MMTNESPDVLLQKCRQAVDEKRRDADAFWLYARLLDEVLAGMRPRDGELVPSALALAGEIERDSGNLPEFRSWVDGSGVLQDLRDARQATARLRCLEHACFA